MNPSGVPPHTVQRTYRKRALRAMLWMEFGSRNNSRQNVPVIMINYGLFWISGQVVYFLKHVYANTTFYSMIFHSIWCSGIWNYSARRYIVMGLSIFCRMAGKVHTQVLYVHTTECKHADMYRLCTQAMYTQQSVNMLTCTGYVHRLCTHNRV